MDQNVVLKITFLKRLLFHAPSPKGCFDRHVWLFFFSSAVKSPARPGTDSSGKLLTSLPAMPVAAVGKQSAPATGSFSSPPQKKTRKQLITTSEDPLASNVPLGSLSKVDEISKSDASTPSQTLNVTSSTATPTNGKTGKDSAQQFPYRRRMPASYGTGYSLSGNGKNIPYHHYQRPGDVRVKGEETRRLLLLSLCFVMLQFEN